MAKNSLFALLSRSPWWLSLVIGAALFTALQSFLPAIVGASAALPFFGIAAYSAWRQLRTPSADLGALRELSWERASPMFAEAFRREGYEVEALGGAADFGLKRKGRVTLAGCRRWKVAQTGVGPLRELVDARRSREADECIYAAAGEFTPQAREFAAANRVQLLAEADVARLLARVPRPKTTEKT